MPTRNILPNAVFIRALLIKPGNFFISVLKSTFRDRQLVRRQVIAEKIKSFLASANKGLLRMFVRCKPVETGVDLGLCLT